MYAKLGLDLAITWGEEEINKILVLVSFFLVFFLVLVIQKGEMKVEINVTKFGDFAPHDVETHEVIRPRKIPNAGNIYFLFFIC